MTAASSHEYHGTANTVCDSSLQSFLEKFQGEIVDGFILRFYRATVAAERGCELNSRTNKRRKNSIAGSALALEHSRDNR